jgi:hypothetical protein
MFESTMNVLQGEMPQFRRPSRRHFGEIISQESRLASAKYMPVGNTPESKDERHSKLALISSGP